jgi:hypothetical protein
MEKATEGGLFHLVCPPVETVGEDNGQSGLNLNLAPPSAASYISPPLMIEKDAMPFS